MNNVYLISSNSVYLMEEEIKRIVKDNIYSSFDLNNVELDDVIEEASYFSLFDEAKYMVVKNADIFKAGKKKSDDDGEEKVSKKDQKLLEYLESPNSNTILIFTVYGKVDSKKKICKIIKDRYTFIEIKDFKQAELISIADNKLKEDGYKADKFVLNYIVNNCLNNYDLIFNEISKIKLYYGKGTKLNLDEVSNIVSRNVEDNNFKFIEVVMKKDIKEAFKMLDDLMLQKVEPIMLLSMFAKEIRLTLLTKKLCNKRYDKRSIMENLGIKFDFQVDKLINNAYNFKESELEHLLLYLCDMDLKIKSGKISNKLAIEMFIMEMCK